jgi:phosphoenolpyruvate synthase/pyruvate phosphate dikinase
MIRLVGLGNISRDQVSIVGGKGAKPGFVVTAESYREHIKDLDLTRPLIKSVARS